ncbi:MAG TPA: hypothetical protein VIM12_20915 [Noviherbaspirillum sp.]|jgi:hypothetical protein|uniref:hypothetical protein n=1 Tax=Noviherbaspirillum sp. TaxID=1926288 RepID=UPI002F93DC25
MDDRKHRQVLPAILACILLIGGPGAAAAEDHAADFACGGRVESETWALWDDKVRAGFEREMLRERLLEQGDTYALYDLQLYSHSLWSMAGQCNRAERLREAAALVRAAYTALQPVPGAGRGWICKGGTICAENALVDTEVKLVSFQFLGLASFIANALARSPAPRTPEDSAFIDETVRIVVEHMVRWASDYEMHRLQMVSNARLSEIRKDDSFLLFSDQDLWQLTIYAELAGLLQSQARRHNAGIDVDPRIRPHLNALLKAFAARVSMQRTSAGRMPNVDMADLDRGYWARMSANRFAGYEGAGKPVECSPVPRLRMPARLVALRTDTGWDFSHARRLVQALDAFERNRAAMKSVFGISESRMPRPNLSTAFAATLVNRIWNGDMVRPLFANYWSGANGWFGARYDTDAAACSEGMTPYAMTDTFPTGGFITWSRRIPLIGALGRRLYDLTRASAPDEAKFIDDFYPTLGRKIPEEYRALHMTMFLASLVGAAQPAGPVPGPVGTTGGLASVEGK